MQINARPSPPMEGGGIGPTPAFVCFLFGSSDLFASLKPDVRLAQCTEAQFVSTSIARTSGSCPLSPLFSQQLAAGTQTASSLPALKDTFGNKLQNKLERIHSVLRMGCHHPSTFRTSWHTSHPFALSVAVSSDTSAPGRGRGWPKSYHVC